MNSGMKFEFGNTKEDAVLDSNVLDDDLMSSDEEGDDIIVREAFLGKPFDELRSKMTPIEHGIYKRLLTAGKGEQTVSWTSRVTVHYNSYLEGESDAFESTFGRKRATVFTMGENMLKGQYYAFLTMKPGEEAQFIIPYTLLYGNLPVPIPFTDRMIPAKSDIFYIVRMVAVEDVGDGGAITNEYIEEADNFANVKERVDLVRRSAKTHFSDGSIAKAKDEYKKCIEALKNCSYPDEAERNALYGQLYLNLAVCYSKLERFDRVLSMTEQLRVLNLFDQNSKALFHHGRAMSKVGTDLDGALKHLDRAQKLEPKNQEIATELRMVNQDYILAKSSMKAFAQRAMNIPSAVAATVQNDPKEVVLAKSHPIHAAIQQFVSNEKLAKYPLPPLTDKELEQVRVVAKLYDLQESCESVNHEKRYFLLKGQQSS